MAKHRGRLFWLQQVEAAASSRLSKAAYCRQHGLNYKAFLRWIARLVGSAVPALQQSLAPLSVATATQDDTSLLHLQIGSGVVLVMPRTADARWLGELMRAAAC